MFRVSDNALNRWWRSLVVAVCLSLFLFLPVFLEIHHSCRLQHIPSDNTYADLAGSVDFCSSCALMRTLLADEPGEVVWSACAEVSLGGCVCAEGLIAGNRGEGSPPPRAPPSVRQHQTA